MMDVPSMNERLGQLRLLPVIALQAVEQAEPLAEALQSGGLPCAEITLRTEAALPAMKRLAGRQDFLLGAGTVHSAREAEASRDAGAQFIVTPGFNPRTVQWCLDHKLPIYPGISSPTDLEMALEMGLEVVKFFPAEVMGGIPALKAFSGPYAGIRFIPTGGVGPGNLSAYLALPSVLACGGSWMVPTDRLAAGDFETIRRLTADAMKLVQQGKESGGNA